MSLALRLIIGRVGGWMDLSSPLARIYECGRGVVERCGMEAVAIICVEGAELRLADTYRVRQHRREYRLQVARRTGDYAQHLGGRRLLLQRLGQVARARLHLVEQPDVQPHVLDRDRRLACESGQQCNLLVREWPHLGATNHEHANGLVLPQQGNGENGPVSEAARVRAALGELVGGGLEVVHVDRFPINEGAPGDPAAPARRTDKLHWDRAVMSSDTKPFTLT